MDRVVTRQDSAAKVTKDSLDSQRGFGLFVSCLTSQQHASVFSVTNLLRQFYVLPHWDRSCRSNVLPHLVTLYWYRADQSQRWPYNAKLLAGSPLECQFLSHWYDSTRKKSRRTRDSNPGSFALEADALTTKPTRRSGKRNLELSTSDSKAGAAPISSGTSLPQAVSNIFHLPCCQSHRCAYKQKKGGLLPILHVLPTSAPPLRLTGEGHTDRRPGKEQLTNEGIPGTLLHVHPSHLK